jgi:hypothetical protein
MALPRLTVGSSLPEFHVSAPYPAEPHENKIHEDGLARQYGFKGGLVPGVTVYAWMTHPVVEALGSQWLERGRFQTRLARPIYYEEAAVVRARVASREGDAVAIEVAAHNAAGLVCGTATMSLSPGSGAGAPEADTYAVAPLPDERPQVSRRHLEGLTVLGTPQLHLTPEAIAQYLERYGETLALYRGPSAPAHPAIHLDLANRALDRNVRLSPWIHVESDGRHVSAARAGERLEMRGRIKSLFEKKGHQFVELDLLLVAEGSRPVAAIRHVAIYQLRATT